MSAFADMFTSHEKPRAIGVVSNSVELQRILALPRRVLDLSTVDDVTPLFAKSGVLSYWPIQSAALIEAHLADGLFAPIGVGHGKTLICLSLPEAMDSRRAVYLVKADLKRQLEREAADFYSRHFHLPLNRITIVSYDELSSMENASVLDEIEPDLIICDEAHCLRNCDSTRTDRFLRYARENPSCRYAFLSGTMTTRSILDYAHMLELALRENSPLPRGYHELMDWSGALDVSPEYYVGPGALRRFCSEGEDVRSGYRRRLLETRGVVATSEGAIGTSLVLRRLLLELPDETVRLMREVQDSWMIEGREIKLATEHKRVLKQLACGFYYRWAWPNDEPDYEWLEARSEWHGEVREKLKHSRRGMDSPALLARAAERHRVWSESRTRERRPVQSWDSRTWARWRLVKDRRAPPVEAVWQSDFLVDATIEWVRRQDAPCIVWSSWTALGERIAQKGGLPFFDSGTDASISSDNAIVASLSTQGTGKNLQHFCRNLFTSVPPNGTLFEQAIGRTHRPGQMADEVTGDWFGHVPELRDAMRQIVRDAKYVQDTKGLPQKVLYADKNW